MVRVYAADISYLPDPVDNPDILNKLSEKRLHKISKLSIPLKRKQCAYTQLLFEKVLRINDIPKKEFLYKESGKPYTDGICFSLSHSHNMVICAISEHNVGCDIEKISERKINMSKRIFSFSELNFLKGLKNAEKNKAFFRLWTIKESYLKFTGEGLNFSPCRLSVFVEDKISIHHEKTRCLCNIKEYALTDYCISVCAEEDIFSDSIEFVDISTGS